MFGEFCRGIEVSLAECRASAAAAVFHERNFKSKRFEHFHRSNADVRLVIPHEGVVPKNDFAASERGRRPRRLAAVCCPFEERRSREAPRYSTASAQTICRSVHLRNGAANVVRRFQLFSPLRCAPP